MGQFLVTGAFSGLGLALSRELHAREFEVIGLGRKIGSREPEILAGFQAVIELDLSHPEPEQLDHQIHTLVNDYPGLNLVLNAAQIDPLGPLGILKSSAIIDAVNVNLTSALLLINSFIRWSPTSSKIFVVGTGAVNTVIEGWDIYSISKLGLKKACDFVNQQHPGRAIWIDPGVIDTTMQSQLRESGWALSNVKLRTPREAARVIADQVIGATLRS